MAQKDSSKLPQGKTLRREPQPRPLDEHERYRNLFDGKAGGIFLSDRDGNFLDVNARGCKMLGYARREILGMNVRDLIPAAKSKEESRQAVKRLLDGERLPPHERVFRKKDGGLLPVEINVELSKDAGGQPLHILGVTRDITHRKDAGLKLEESEKRFRALIENAAEMILAIDENGIISYASPSVKEIMGYGPKEIVGRNFLEWIHPADLPLTAAALESRSQKPGTAPASVIVQCRHKNGKWRFVEALGTNLLAEDAVRSIVINARDVTERIEAERALQESETKYRTLMEQLPAVVYVDALDGKGTSLFVSSQVESILGISVEDWMNSDFARWLDFIHPEDRQRMTALFADLKAPGQTFEIEYRMGSIAGKTIWVRDVGSILEGADGRLLVHGVIFEVTENKTIEEKYRAIFEDAVEGIFQSTPEGRFLTVNNALARMWGYDSPEDLIASVNDITTQIFVQPMRRAEFAFEIEEKGEALGFEYEARRKDGRTVWVSENTRAVRSPGGKLLYYEGNVEDITEKRRAQQALQENEELLKEAQAMAGLGGYVLDIPSGAWKSSDILNGIFGIDSSYDTSVQGWAALIHPDDQESLLAYLQNDVIGKRQPFDREYRVIRQNDRAERWVHGMGRLEFNSAGAPAKMVGAIQDITERKQHEREREALASVAQMLKQGMELDALLQNLLKVALSAIPAAEKGSLALLAGEDRLTVRAIRGYENSDILGFTYPTSWGYAGRVFRQRRAELVSDVLEDEQLSEDSRKAKTGEVQALRSAVVAPLFVQDSILGILSLESARPNAFDKSDLEMLTAFAASAALIIERARLFDETRRQLDEQSAVHRASQSLLNAGLDLETVCASTHAAVASVMPCDAFVIALADENGGDYQGVYLFDTGQRHPPRRVPRGEGLCGRVITSGETLFIGDNLLEQSPSVHFGSSRQVRSVIAVPLKKENRVVGMVSAQSYQPEVYEERHRILLETFAAQLTTALENARLFAESNQRVAELETLHASGLSLNQSFHPKEIGRRIIQLLEQKLDWHHTSVRVVQGELLELLAFNQAGLHDEAVHVQALKQAKKRVTRIGEGLSGWAVQHAQIARSGDVNSDPRYVDTFAGVNSGLYVPMKIGERVIGVIAIESERPNAFTEADERLVATIASQAASALENARLLEEARQRVARLETLNRVSITLRAIAGQKEMLAVILEETLKTLDVPAGFISLWDHESRCLRQAAARGWPVEMENDLVKSGDGIWGTVFARGESYVAADFQNDALVSPKTREKFPPGWGGICVPIRSTDETLGIFMVAAPGGREFAREELRLVNTLADMTGAALHRMNLHAETMRRAREFESLYETSRSLSAENDLNTLLVTITNRAAHMLEAPAGGIYLYDAEAMELEMAYSLHSIVAAGTRLKLGEGLAGRVAETRRPLRVDNYSAWEGRSPKFENAPIRAVLEVPILYGGELIGVLTAEETNASTRKFNDADERLLSLFASQAAGVIKSTRLHQETIQRLKRLQALRVIDRAIAGSLDKRVTLNLLVDQIISQLEVDAADVLLLHTSLQNLQFAAGHGFYTRLNESANIRVGESFAGRAVLERRIQRVDDDALAGKNRAFHEFWRNEGFRNYYAVPLLSKGRVLGVLEVFRRTPFRPDMEWLNFLETLADQTAIALDNAQLFENVQSVNMDLSLAYDATIEGWSHAMELRDEETEGHTQRVTEMALALARAAGIKEGELLHIRRGALLHDIGKIGVPDHILRKKGPLDEKEWEIMRRHPTFAYEMLRPIAYLRLSLDIPYKHHEKWDGTGYPQGLVGEQIPLAARIFAIVDVYDALTNDRPYREAWSHQKTLEYLRQQSGKHFDPQVVEKFLEAFGDKPDRDAVIASQ